MNIEPAFKKIIFGEFSRRLDLNRSYSLRAFARALRIPASALSEILSGKRIPSHKVAHKIIAMLDLTPQEQERFLQSVAEAKQGAGAKRIAPGLKEFLGPKDPTQERKELSIDLFRVIGDWYHYAILFLTEVEGFSENPKWIAGQLGLSESEAILAIQRLLDLGLLRRKKGRLVVWEKEFTTADKHVTTGALRRHMRQILEKATYSLENDPIERRSITAMTMAVDPKRIPKAKEMIEDSIQKISKYLEGGKKSEVYEININLFPLQRTKKGASNV